jgi:hypothetical protein
MVVFLLTATVGLNGLNSSGVSCNHIDIAPNYAGTLMGISNSASNTMGFVTPWIVSLVTGLHEDLDHWQTIFCMAAVIYVVGNLFFIMFATGEVQSFNELVPRLAVGEGERAVIVTQCSKATLYAHFLSDVRVSVCLSFNSSEMSGRIKMKFSGHEETISEGAYF